MSWDHNVLNDREIRRVKIGNRFVGDGEPCFVVAEIGINHNGSLDIAKPLIDVAVKAGADAVKFQKRTVEVVYSKEELEKPRESPFGNKNGDLKRGLEFGYEQYKEIDRYCREKGIMWLASCWDEASVDFIEQFSPPCYKVASACLTDSGLLLYTCSKNKPLVISTGMSTMDEIKRAVRVVRGAIGENFILLHCTSTYPCDNDLLNLSTIITLRNEFHVPVGYSGHEKGVSPSIMAVTQGACLIERHLTLDRAMWGSDQAASLEPKGFELLVRDIRIWETVRGSGVKGLHPSEIPIMKKLRRKNSLPPLQGEGGK